MLWKPSPPDRHIFFQLHPSCISPQSYEQLFNLQIMQPMVMIYILNDITSRSRKKQRNIPQEPPKQSLKYLEFGTPRHTWPTTPLDRKFQTNEIRVK